MLNSHQVINLEEFLTWSGGICTKFPGEPKPAAGDDDDENFVTENNVIMYLDMIHEKIIELKVRQFPTCFTTW